MPLFWVFILLHNILHVDPPLEYLNLYIPKYMFMMCVLLPTGYRRRSLSRTGISDNQLYQSEIVDLQQISQNEKKLGCQPSIVVADSDINYDLVTKRIVVSDWRNLFEGLKSLVATYFMANIEYPRPCTECIVHFYTILL